MEDEGGQIVLNALRHQRFWQLNSRIISYQQDVCSTPCGIRGFGRTWFPADESYQTVLNALRHQRFWQLEKQAASSLRMSCSTPCGIRGFGRSRG